MYPTFLECAGAVLGLAARGGRAGETFRRFSWSFSSLFMDLSKDEISPSCLKNAARMR
jgi:hypothetical protein